ncbi:hypothetical protein ACFCZY_40725 [Streptomyces sp. NPDC056237]|uniref:hypothetical protein n=1 Tax=unclassified Streptomyces TaxID=2593676 RepID=UPI0035E39DD9
MSVQPKEAPAPPAPVAAAQLCNDRRADTWVPAFDRDWAKALENSRHTYSLTPCTTSSAPDSSAAPAVDACMDSGCDESGFVDLDAVLGARR